MKIIKNENNIDRIIRVILAIVFFILAFFWLSGIAQIVFYILALVMLFTAISGFCGLYRIFNINTNKK